MLQALAAHPALLPYRIVGVLNSQDWQGIVLALMQCRVQREQFASQHAQRPTVGDDVVHRQQQHMLLVFHL